MFAVFMELVKRVGIFVIIGQTILHFGISQKYEKYMKLVISFMVGAQIVFAFGVYLTQEDNKVVMVSAKEYFQKWERQMEKMEKKMEEGNHFMMQSTQKEVKSQEEEKINEQKSLENRIEIEKIIIQ